VSAPEPSRPIALPSAVPARLATVACVLLGLLAAELFLRVVSPFAIFYSTWFDPGIHVPDPELGFVFKPGYRGNMRHVDQTWTVPLELDEHGFRPAARTQADEPGKQVVFLGGYSIMFSFGLGPSETVAAQFARHAPVPVTAHSTAWPGFDLDRELRKFERFLAPVVEPDLVVVLLSRPGDYAFAAGKFDPALPEPGPDLFRYHESLVLAMQQRPFTRFVGRSLCFESYLVGGLCEQADRLIDSLADAVKALRAAPRGPGAAAPASAGHHPESFLVALRDRLAARGARLAVVALPTYGFQGPEDLEPLVPEGVPVFDLRRLLAESGGDWKALHHYGPRSAELVGARLAERLGPLLEARRAEAPHAP
jgi:hypothetical protein